MLIITSSKGMIFAATSSGEAGATGHEQAYSLAGEQCHGIWRSELGVTPPGVCFEVAKEPRCRLDISLFDPFFRQPACCAAAHCRDERQARQVASQLAPHALKAGGETRLEDFRS